MTNVAQPRMLSRSAKWLIIAVIAVAVASAGALIWRPFRTSEQGAPALSYEQHIVRVRQALGQVDQWRERVHRQAAVREESPGAQEAYRRLKASPPNLNPYLPDALAIVRENRGGEPEFLAALVALTATRRRPDNLEAWDRTSGPALHRWMASILLDRHVRRADFMTAGKLIHLPTDDSIRYWTAVSERSPSHDVQAKALRLVARHTLTKLEDPSTDRSQAQSLRQAILAVARRVEADYHDVPEAISHVRVYVTSLATAPGAVLRPAQLVELDGRPASMAQFRGKYVLVDIWSTSCTWCRVEHPRLEQIAARLPSNFIVVGVSMDEDPAILSAYLQRNPLPWRNLRAPDYRLVFDKWGVAGMPTYLIVAPDGRLLQRGSRLTDAFITRIRETAAAATS